MPELTLQNAKKYLDPTTVKNLENVKKHRLKKDYDFVITVVGDMRRRTGVGDGKSTLAQELCATMSEERFTLSHILFDEVDYKILEPKLVPLDSYMFDEPDLFFSTEAMTGRQRKIKLKFAKIRQKMNFIVICAPSIMMFAKWLRPGGESRMDVLLRVTKRGVFYSYSKRTGSLDKIRIDARTGKIIWPPCDYIGFFKKIPKKSEWWKRYMRKKNNYLRQSDENPKAVKLMKKERMKMRNTLTLREISVIHKVGLSTVKRWYRDGVFGKRGVFLGIDNRIRVKMKAYYKGIKKVKVLKQKGLAKRGKRGKDKRPRRKRRK